MSHNKLNIKSLLTVLLALACLNILAQTKQTRVYQDKAYKNNLKTIQFHKLGDKMTPPVIDKNKYQKLLLSFDEIAENATDYYYTIRLCRHNWHASPLPTNYYIQGFEDNPVEDYSLSFNTTYNFVHYEIEIPNDNIEPTLCGNYVIIVYEEGMPDSPVLTKKFVIIDPAVKIKAQVKMPEDPSKQYTHQKVRLSIRASSLQINRPAEQLSISISKNKPFKEAVLISRPTNILGNEFVYDNDSLNIFAGGNEFRHFNSKSLKNPLENINQIAYTRPYYNVYLTPDKSKALKPYIFKKDINGRYSIDNELNSSDIKLASDYVFVHFTLPYNVPLMEGNFYVYGKLNSWECDSSNMLRYNYKQKSYDCTMLLKQGYYDYAYAYKQSKNSLKNLQYLEGNHYDTENEYYIMVYEKDRMEEHDRPVGFKIIKAHNDK